MRIFFVLLMFLGFSAQQLRGEENFILIDGSTNEIIKEFGSNIEERVTPASSFKIVLSLMGYDAGILQDEHAPTWDFQKGYDDCLESWKQSQNPQTWITRSCIWYSKIIAAKLGLETIQHYLSSFEYGNQDLSIGLVPIGPINPAWVSSSLKISPKEQVEFLQKMIQGRLPVSSNALQMTRNLLFKEEMPQGWKLFGKTALGSTFDENGKKLKVRWFVGWVENNQAFFPFAYLLQEQEIDLSQTIRRVKQLLEISLEVVLDEAKEIDFYLSSITGGTSFHGAVMIKQGTKILLSKGYGYARLAGANGLAIPNTATTLFHIGSITKQFTAAALMKLAEAGKITIDGKINDYLPNEYQSALWNNITIKQLLTHTSGLGDYLEDPNYLKKAQNPYFNVDSIIKEAMEQKNLTYPVGEFHYSNTGYLLLGAIIEKVSHKSYGQFMREFLNEAGMHETGVHDDTFEESPGIAHGYYINTSGKKLEEDLTEDLARTCGADGNIYSSLNDLARWSDILSSRNDIISSESLKEMTTPLEKGYGYGIKIEKSFKRTKISHNGKVPGFASSFYKFPQEGMLEELFIVVLGNNGCFPSEFIAQYITDFFLLGTQGEYPKLVLDHNFSGDSCIGFFKSVKHGTQFKLIEQEGHLFIHGLDGLQRLFKCYLLSNQRLYVPGRSTQLEYKDNEITIYKEGKAIDHLRRIIALK